MDVYQRIYEYETTEGQPPTGEEVPHKDKRISAIMKYVEADGHYHWHLQHVAYYSLWDSSRTAEVAPAQKVGFCLDDSEHVEENVGPPSKVYADNVPPFRHFCEQFKPEATSVFEGISAGWRDLYSSNLAYQWVDASDVLPGEYWLRVEVNPEHTIEERGVGSKIQFATSPSVIPGFDARAQSQSAEYQQSLDLTLSSTRWGTPEAAPEYTIVAEPKHGQLAQVKANQTVYTPETGYSGADSFTFSARDPGSQFPSHPEIATVAITVGKAPSVAIEGAPSSMIAGTSVQLSALVSNDSPAVKWSASAGSIAPTGSTAAIYTAPSAPPTGNLVTVVSESPKGARDLRTIEIVPVPTAQPRPEVPSQPTPPTESLAPTPHVLASVPPPGLRPLTDPTAMLIGRKLYMTVTPQRAGRLRLTALLRSHRIGSCVAQVKRRQSFTCATTLPPGISSSAPISVWATLRISNRTVQTVRPAAKVGSAAKAMAAASWLGVKQAWRYLCGM
jgi:Lysyl oxidase/Bacterial Ig domain